MHDMLPRVLVATAAANTMIYRPLLGMDFRGIGLPYRIVMLLQDMRQNARFDGMTGVFFVITRDWRMFIRLLLSVLLPG